MRYTDPRDLVTREAFVIAPALLGLPLARPWRRGVAIAVDLALVSLLAKASGVLLGLAAAAFFLRVSGRAGGGTLVGRSMRFWMRASAAVVLFITAWSLWDSAWSRLRRSAETQVVRTAESRLGGTTGLGAAVGLGADLVSLRRTSDEGEARTTAHRAARRLSSMGTQPADVAEALRDAAKGMQGPPQAAVHAVADSVAPAEKPAEAVADSLVLAYATALQEEDTASASRIRSDLNRTVAADTVGALATQLGELRKQNRELRSRLDAASESEGVGILSLIRTVADELGIGFGWAALYFTAFLVLWRGQTPGKRLLGIRVLRLDGKPITWWMAFERFGGYVAGIFTGLLDYFLILRDRNRQALHDKIVDTVVVWEPKGSGASASAAGAAPGEHASGALPGQFARPLSR